MMFEEVCSFLLAHPGSDKRQIVRFLRTSGHESIGTRDVNRVLYSNLDIVEFDTAGARRLWRLKAGKVASAEPTLTLSKTGRWRSGHIRGV